MRIGKFVLGLMLVVISQSTIAETDTGHSKRSQPIIGFAPIMKSIGATLDLQQHHLFYETGKPVVSVGSTLFVPSAYCVSKINTLIIRIHGQQFFDFRDKDNDDCLHTRAHELNWFILDNPNTAWENVKNWEDLNTTLITTERFPNALIPAGIIPQSPYTNALLIPQEAKGLRIGFTYTPIAETGEPQSGQIMKVWDLNHFFGQYQPPAPGVQTEANPGNKLNEIEFSSGGGIIEGNYSLPEIKNLIMNGTFWLGESLEASYDFVAHSEEGTYEDVSRLWWGSVGSTKDNAFFQNPNYSIERHSPILTQDDINSVIEVSVLPIKKENGFFVVGTPATVTSEDENNNFSSLPSIQSLTFNDELILNKNISATYEFNDGGAVHAEDKSTYLWEYQNTEEEWINLSGGTIVESGVVPASPALTQAQAGMTLKLTVEPKDQLGRIGDPVFTSNQIEGLDSVELSPKAVEFDVYDTDSQKITATAIYSKGTKITLKENEGTWSTDNPMITVTNGMIKIAANNTVEQSGTITFNYQTKTDTTSVRVNPLPPSISNVIVNNGDIIKPNSSIGATYQFSNGGKIGAVDKSTYRWYTKETINSNELVLASGTISTSGIVPNSPTISLDKAGWLIYLDLTAKDQERTGTTVTESHTVEQVPKITNLSFTNQVNGELKILNQAYVAYQFHNVNDSQDRSSYRFYLKNDSGSQVNLSSGTIGETNGQSSGSLISPTIPLDKAGWDLYFEITPKDANERVGIASTIKMPIERLLSLDFTPESFYVLIPTQFTATASYSQGSNINVTELGEWSSQNTTVTFANKGIATANDLSLYDTTLLFTYGGLTREKIVPIYHSNVSEVYGSVSGYFKHLTINDENEGYGSGFYPWGSAEIDSIKNNSNGTLVGGGGKNSERCGTTLTIWSCDFSPSQIKPNTYVRIDTLDDNAIVKLAWENKFGQTYEVTGYKQDGTRVEHNHLVKTSAELYGLYFYGTIKNGSQTGPIQGIRFVYKP